MPRWRFDRDTISAADLRHLSLDERIQLVEDLWDDIAADAAESPEALPLTPAQEREILRRSQAHRRSPAEAIPLDEALDRIERSLG